MRIGVAPLLESEANRLLRDSMSSITKYSEKADIITPAKEKVRKRREMLSPMGFADPTYRRGMYNRVMNPTLPHLNSADGNVRPRIRGHSSLEAFVHDNALED